jgi:hypothetical protein
VYLDTQDWWEHVAILFTQDWWEHVAILQCIYTGLVGTCGSIYLHRIGGNMWQYLFTQDRSEHVAVSIYTGLVGTCGSIYLHRIGENMWQYLFTQDRYCHMFPPILCK